MPSKQDILAFCGSLAIHLAFLAFIVYSIIGGGPEADGQASGSPDSMQVEVVEREQPQPEIEEIVEEEEVIEDTEPELIVDQFKKPPKELTDCPAEWYGGIGIMVSFDDVVLQVYRGYSAAAAGLQAGDILLDQHGATILGEPGTFLLLTVQRGSQVFTMRLQRVKVCY
jgi:hypothetical protein